MSYPTPTRQDHHRFCEVEEWEQVRNARGKRGSHHITYERQLPNGDLLRTRISHPPDRSEYGPSMWSHILKDQLQVTEEQFWDAVDHGTPPDRPGPRPERDALPTDIVWQLRTNVGLSDAEIAGLSVKEAKRRLADFYGGSS